MNRYISPDGVAAAALQSTRLLDQVRERIRYLHYSLQTEKADLHWVRFPTFPQRGKERGGAPGSRVALPLQERPHVVPGVSAETPARRSPVFSSAFWVRPAPGECAR